MTSRVLFRARVQLNRALAHLFQAGQGWLIEPRPGTVRTTQNSPTNRALVVKRALARFKLASVSTPLENLVMLCVAWTTKWTLCCNILSANMSFGELSLPGDLLLPLDTQENLPFLDNSMRQDKELLEQFLRFLTIKCERDLKTTMWRMLQSIFSNHLSINITWSGVGDKACFRDMFLKTIVQRAIRKNPATQDATDEAIQVNVTHHLKGASDHAGGKRHR
ncbi:uncharacterized protein LOC120464170 [Pimephales promelas]|uniref:uncharacterized protein LOC120464170 n=1 Tax=Pimephales promelas TaxID=90988 RepID=UPI001955CD7D|nr:uncharacterized protein LOC120464170 [Pimephales promelas]